MKELRTEYPNLKYDPARPMPMEPIYQQMIKRPNTYFIDFNGITYTSPALMCKEVMEADTIYWFSDFMDAVDESHIADVKKKLKNRKQKLYMHASVHGRSFEKCATCSCSRSVAKSSKPRPSEIRMTKSE
jgi:hypothetical protein